jgi:hypothetical protein
VKKRSFLCKGNSLLDLANKNVEANANFSLAAKAYQDLMQRKTSGKVKFFNTSSNFHN